MPRGRPRKNPLPDSPSMESLGINEALMEQDLRAFFLHGKPQRLQRWFTNRDPETADLIAAHMLERFADKIASLMPSVEEEA